MARNLFEIPLVFFLFLCLFSFHADAVIVNDNYNYTNMAQVSNGILYTSSACSAYLNQTWNDTYLGSQGIAESIFDWNPCYPNTAQDFYFYAFDNSNSTIFHLAAGNTSVYLKIFNNPHTPPTNADTTIQIRDANNGTIYKTADINFVQCEPALTTWCYSNTSIVFNSSVEVQILGKFTWINSIGGWDTYIDYFMVNTSSCTAATYCTDATDYKITNSSCAVYYGSCAPLACQNILDYSLGNSSNVVGVGCYNSESEQLSGCLDIEGHAIDCPAAAIGDLIALAIGSILGIINLELAKAFASLVIALILTLIAGFLARKEKDWVGKIMFLILLVVLAAFAIINWFPAWLLIVLAILAAAIIAGVSKGIFG